MIENTSILDKKALIALNLNHFKRTLLPVSLVLEILLVGLTILLTMIGGDESLTEFLWLFIVLYPILMALIFGLTIRKIYKSDLIIQNKTSVHFLFQEEFIEVEVKNDLTESKSMIRYSLLHHALNTKNYLFLYQNAMTALVVDKNAFSVGTEEDLLSVLKKNNVKIKNA
ncbi:MAG TPA: YcxB family protein [Candidatus Izemoplasmatales bacterium]|nr:YcxB family protein [Bacillota bacterium]HRY78695.1 YcxB family protein [Candidatus Izemoplasmatales bacterium]